MAITFKTMCADLCEGIGGIIIPIISDLIAGGG